MVRIPHYLYLLERRGLYRLGRVRRSRDRRTTSLDQLVARVSRLQPECRAIICEATDPPGGVAMILMACTSPACARCRDARARLVQREAPVVHSTQPDEEEDAW